MYIKMQVNFKYLTNFNFLLTRKICDKTTQGRRKSVLHQNDIPIFWRGLAHKGLVLFVWSFY